MSRKTTTTLTGYVAIIALIVVSVFSFNAIASNGGQISTADGNSAPTLDSGSCCPSTAPAEKVESECHTEGAETGASCGQDASKTI